MRFLPDVDIILVIFFLLLTLVVGIYHGQKVKDLRDYALGSKNFPTSTLAATILATWLSGSSLFVNIEHTYSQGLYYLIAGLGGPLAIWLYGQLAVRMEPFMNNLSVAEAMGSMYGQTVQLITATTAIMARIGYTAIQFQVMGIPLTNILHLDSTFLTIVAACITVLYTSLGGIRAVTFTDVLQFFTFFLIMILALSIWSDMQGLQVAHTLSNNPLFDLRTLVGQTPRFMAMLGLFLYMSIPAYYPYGFQRVAMARDTQQAKQAFTYAAVIVLFMFMLQAWMGILLLADNPAIPPGQVIPYLIQRHASVGLRGMLGVGIIAVAMSTADSVLNACSVLFANDLVKPLARQDTGKVITARIFSFFMGLAAVVLALHNTDLLRIALLSGSCYMPIVTVPLLMAILGFRSTTRAVLIGMAAGGMTVLLWSIFLDNADSIVPGMLANLLGLMGSHYLLREPGGWVETQGPGPWIAIRRAWWEQRQALLQTFSSYQPHSYLAKHLPTQSSTYLVFGLYIFGVTYASFFLLPFSLRQHTTLIQNMLQGVLMITAASVTYPIWPYSLRVHPLLPWLWPLACFYTLFLLGSLLAMLSGLPQDMILICCCNLIVAALLLPRTLFITMLLVALPTSWWIFKAMAGADALPTNFAFIQFSSLYTWFLLIICLLAVVRLREKYGRARRRVKQLQLEQHNEELIGKLASGLQPQKEYLTALQPDASKIGHRIKELTTEVEQHTAQIKRLKMHKASHALPALHSAHALTEDLTKLTQLLGQKLPLKVSKHNPYELLSNAVTCYRAQASDSTSEVMLQVDTKHKQIACDEEKIKQLISNSLAYGQVHNKEKKPMIVRVEDAFLGYQQAEGATVAKMAALRICITTLEDVFKPLEACYRGDALAKQGSLVYLLGDNVLLENRQIVDAHYGYLGHQLVTPTDYHLLYVIPAQWSEAARLIAQNG